MLIRHGFSCYPLARQVRPLGLEEDRVHILGISAFYHDSAAVLLRDGEIVAAAQEERFTRKKHDRNFPEHAVRFCLEYGGITTSDLAAVVFYDKPLLKLERLLETYRAYAPAGLRQFVVSMPVWLREKLFLKKRLRDHLRTLGPKDATPKLLFSEHHLSHAASAYYPSPFEEAAILTIDGVGEWATATIGHGTGAEISLLRQLDFPHSVGLLYSAFTAFLGFRVNSGEYKLMGLAPYGDRSSEEFARYRKLILDKIVDVAKDGSIWLDPKYFAYSTGLEMVRPELWHKLFGFPARAAESELEACHCNLAAAIQSVTEDIVSRMAAEALRLTGSRNLCLAGGVALNCVANGKLLQGGSIGGLWIQPAAGDAGGALGAALSAHHTYFEQQREPVEAMDGMRGSYLGPEWGGHDIEALANRLEAPYTHFDDFGELCSSTAKLLDDGAVVGWFQGRMEWGPRALGNRSILADARNVEMQRKLNLKIKYREGFRPFAPSVLEECREEYFDLAEPSPYMLLVANVVPERCARPAPEAEGTSWREKLYAQRSDVPAITHVDYTARMQTVHRETNERYWTLINAFRQLTGHGLVVNTSFNVRGEPIVCSPEDAYDCFMNTEMDYLVMENFVFDKRNQPQPAGRNEDRRAFEPD